jgi:O-antigen/teichoic acid export membrane protein
VLLAKWGDFGYAFCVAVQGFASYVSVADAGVLLYLSRHLAVLRAAGDELAALALSRGGLRAFGALASAGALIVSLAFVLSGRRIWGTLAVTCGMTPAMALAAALAQMVAGGTSLALGGWSSAVDQSRLRYSRIPFFGIVRNVLVTGSTIGFALYGMNPALTLVSISAVLVMFEGLRFALVLSTEPSFRSVQSPPIRTILHEARGSLFYYLATSTQNGLQPYVTAAISSEVVSLAVPTRTLANGARSLATAVASVIWVPVAARFVQLGDGDERLRFWRRNSPTITMIQVAGVAVLLALAPFVVPRWLPSKSDQIIQLLPFYCVEQGVYVATIPSVLLMQAVGSFGTLGALTFAAAVSTVAGTFALVPRYGATGFAAASAASALFVLAPAVLIAEWRYWRASGISAASVLGPRIAVAVFTAATAIPYVHHRRLTVAGLTAILALTAAHAIRARRGIWFRRRV